MRVKLLCKEENRIKYEEMLAKGGFIVSDEATLVLSESDFVPEYIVGKLDNHSCIIPINDIIIIESSGRDIVARTLKNTYKLKETLDYYENYLKPNQFIRISQSVITQRQMIIKISPLISMKFLLHLKGNHKVDVTRTYYYKFKEYIGI